MPVKASDSSTIDKLLMHTIPKYHICDDLKALHRPVLPF